MGKGTTDMSSEMVAEPKRHSWLVDIGIRLVKEKPLGTVMAVATLLLLLIAIFADLIAPYGMNETGVTDFLAPLSAAHPMGGDQLGRDVFSRIIYGARISVIVGLAGAFLGTVISIVVGGLSGYFGGKFDLIVQRFVDAVMCFPGLVVLIVIMSLIGTGLWNIIIALSILGGVGGGSRIVRSAVMTVRENVYVQAAVAIGCPTTRIFVRHIVPNVMAPTIVLFTTWVPGFILSEASLSFIGFGVPPPAPSWGGMLSIEGRAFMFLAPGIAIWPGLALSIVVFSTNLFGDALRDLLDPRLRGGAGRYGMRAKKAKIKSELSSSDGLTKQ